MNSYSYNYSALKIYLHAYLLSNQSPALSKALVIHIKVTNIPRNHQITLTVAIKYTNTRGHCLWWSCVNWCLPLDTCAFVMGKEVMVDNYEKWDIGYRGSSYNILYIIIYVGPIHLLRYTHSHTPTHTHIIHYYKLFIYYYANGS